MPTSVQWLCKWTLRIGGPVVLIYCLVVVFVYLYMPVKPIQPQEAYAVLEAELRLLSQQNAVIRGQYQHLVENKDKLIVKEDGTNRIYHYGQFKIDPQTNRFEYQQELPGYGIVNGQFGRSFPQRYCIVMISWARPGQPTTSRTTTPIEAAPPTLP